VSFPSEPFKKSYVIDSQLPKGTVVFYWPTTDGNDARVSRRLILLASVFSDRLRVKIREEMGGTYSPQARSVASETFPGYGYISTSIDIDPPTADRISNAVVAITDDLAKNGVTDDELERAKKPLLTSLHESVRNNTYWLTAVALRAQEKPLVLTWARTRVADVESITKADLDELARTYLLPGKVSRVTLLPAAKPAGATTPPAALLPSPPKG
jgi:zinc protease